jgi:exopolysaccharide biosynthesis polyprenyl glycosylphosphotransferase
MPMLKRHAVTFTFALGVMDSLCALAAYAIGNYYSAFPEGAETFAEAFRGRMTYFILFVVVWCMTASDHHLFESHRSDSLIQQLIAAARAVLFSIFLSILTLFFLQQSLDRQFILIYGGAALAIIMAERLAMRLFLWSIRRRGLNFRQILVVGANDRARHFVDVIQERGQYGYVIHGILDDQEERMEVFEDLKVSYLGPVSTLEKLLTSEVIDEVYITLPVRSGYEQISTVANMCEAVGVPVRMLADFFPLRIARSRVHLLEDMPLISLTTVPEQVIQLGLKRTFDIISSTLGLMILLPALFLPLAILIKLESRGPVFFFQERVGLNQRRFKMMKFRSMNADAEAHRAELEAMNEADGPVFKIKHDPRVTRIGAFIRKYSLDEFPQLINVWLGHMSLVGPRPPIPAEVEDYSWDQRRRLSVRPGMTGLWQVSGRSDVGFEDWVRLDLQYIDTWSLANDFNILWQTFGVVLRGRGAA